MEQLHWGYSKLGRLVALGLRGFARLVDQSSPDEETNETCQTMNKKRDFRQVPWENIWAKEIGQRI